MSTADTQKMYVPLQTIYGKSLPSGEYVLSPLDIKNLNDNLSHIVKKIQGNLNVNDLDSAFIDTLRSNVIISNTVITNELYAQSGDIVDLRVTRLYSADKVARYWADDSSDIDYVQIEGPTLSIGTGTVILVEGVAQTVQHTNIYDQLLYYKDAVTAETYQTIGMSTEATDYPVIVYEYTELVKGQFFHYPVTIGEATVKVPALKLGAGTGTGNNDTFILYKMPDATYLTYTTDTGIETTVALTDYVDAKMRRVQSCAINTAGGTVTLRMEGMSSDVVLDYAEDTDSITLTWPDDFECTVTIS